MTEQEKKNLSTYDVVLKALGGKKWLISAKPDEIARLNTLKELDKTAVMTKVMKEYGRSQVK